MAETTKKLTKEIAGHIQPLRDAWGIGSVASGLTPQRLATILSNAAEGDLDAYLTLAEEMEERDPHYSSVLRTRKLAVSSLAPTVEAAGEDDKSLKMAEDVKHLINTPQFNDMVDSALDALGKGYSVSEITWDRSGAKWKPSDYKWRDPRFFVFNRDNPEELRLLDDADPVNGIPLPSYKFIVHRPRLKSGLTLRGGLARLVAFSYICKMYGIKDWLAFAEIYGIPLRLGKYGSAATPDDIDTLKTAVSNIGSDAAAVLPESMIIEFQQVAQAANGSDVFARLVEWIDRQVSKAVLGQTMTTDDGSSQAQAKVHNEVRQDIIEADAKQLANTINRDLIKPYIDINYGPQKAYPTVRITLPETQDLAQLADNLAKLVPLGLKVSGAEVRAKLGLSEPAKDAELLGAANPIRAQAANSRHVTGCLCNGCAGRATNRSQPDEIGDIAAELLGDWEQQADPIMAPVRQAVSDAESYDDLLEALPRLLAKMDPAKLTEALAKAGLISYGTGVEGDD